MIDGWRAWVLLAWGIFVPGVLIFALIWFNIKYAGRGSKMICMACLRIRFSPFHWAARLLGFCPGDKR